MKPNACTNPNDKYYHRYGGRGIKIYSEWMNNFEAYQKYINVIEISDISAPELDVFARMTETQLRSKLDPEKGIFIAESPTVIRIALDAVHLF